MFVTHSPEGPSVITLEISGLERGEWNLSMTLTASTAGLLALLGVIAHLGAGWLVRPLSTIATALSLFAPNRRRQRLPVDPSGTAGSESHHQCL